MFAPCHESEESGHVCVIGVPSVPLL